MPKARQPKSKNRLPRHPRRGHLQFADLDKIAKANFKFAIDCMYGSGPQRTGGIFQKRGIQHVQIRSEVNPLFSGN